MGRQSKTVVVAMRLDRRVARMLLGDWGPIYGLSDPWDFLNRLRVAARAHARLVASRSRPRRAPRFHEREPRPRRAGDGPGGSPN